MQTIKLYLAYFLLLSMLIMGGFGLASYFEAQRLQVQLDELAGAHRSLAEANKVSQQTINELKDLRQNDQTVLVDFTKTLAHHDLSNREVRTKIATLEKSNAQIALLLDTILPPDGCVLDNSCAAR